MNYSDTEHDRALSRIVADFNSMRPCLHCADNCLPSDHGLCLVCLREACCEGCGSLKNECACEDPEGDRERAYDNHCDAKMRLNRLQERGII